MAVDPDTVKSTPMPRNPAPVSATRPVTIAVSIIRPVAEFDVDTDCFGGVDKATHGKEYRKK